MGNSNAATPINVYLTPTQRAQIIAAAGAADESAAGFIRRIVCQSLGIDDFTLQSKERVSKYSLPADGKREHEVITPELEMRIRDLRKRKWNKQAVSAITRVPYKEVEKRWKD